MLSNDLKMILAQRDVSKSELARLLDDSPQNLGLKFKRNTFKDEDLHEIFSKIGVIAEITYFDSKTGEEIFKSKI